MTSLRSTTLAACLVVEALVAPGGASAQEPAPAQPTEEPSNDGAEQTARELFERGNRALSEYELMDAESLYRRSLEAFPSKSAALMLAQTLRALGRSRETIVVADALLRGEYGPMPTELIAQARIVVAGARAELAQITVTVHGAARATLEVDDHAATEVARGRPLSVEVDAGEHVVFARAPGYDTVRERVLVRRGGRRAVAIHLEPAGAAAGGNAMASPWLWVAAGAVALGVVGAALVIGLADEEPLVDSHYGTVAVLRAP